MKATVQEEASANRLREQCVRRSVAFKVAQRDDGQWRGVVFSLIAANPAVVAVTRPTRLDLLHRLSAVVRARWVKKLGKPTNAEQAARGGV